MKSLITLILITTAHGGSFDPAAGQPGSLAIALDDPRIRGWAETVHSYQPGADVDETWQTPNKALGPATGNPFDVVGLGRGGLIEFSWAVPLLNGPGPDIAIFENSFSDRFLELAHVEVSSDGQNWQRFPSISHTPAPIGSFGVTDPTHLHGLAGKYRATFGTGFDFSTLPANPLIDPNAIRFIRLIDVVGDGSDLDSLGNPIYDPYPTFGSAGFDLDALAVLAPPPLTLLKSTVTNPSVTFTWTVEPGKTYTLESSPHLTNDPWQPIHTLTPTTRSFTHQSPISPRSFFRLRESP